MAMLRLPMRHSSLRERRHPFTRRLRAGNALYLAQSLLAAFLLVSLSWVAVCHAFGPQGMKSSHFHPLVMDRFLGQGVCEIASPSGTESVHESSIVAAQVPVEHGRACTLSAGTIVTSHGLDAVSILA